MSGGYADVADVVDRREPAWIEKMSGITAEQTIASIKKELEIKANLDAEDVMAIARQQTGLRDCGGTTVERVHDLSTELGIYTGWDSPSPQLWVGGIPRQHAQNKKLLVSRFEKYGKVVGCTIRYKPRSALEGNTNKSWALVTFSDVAAASRTLRGEVWVTDEDGESVLLKVCPQDTEAELSKEHDVWGENTKRKGKLARIAETHEAEKAKAERLEISAKRPKRGRKSGNKQNAASSSGSAQMELEEERQDRLAKSKAVAAKVHKANELVQLRAELDEQGLDMRGGLDELRERLEGVSGANGVSVGGGGRLGISGGFTFAHESTLWVGGIPSELLAGSVDEGDRRLRKLFAPFGGRVVSVSTRKKDGHFSSWGLVTLSDRQVAKKALRADLVVPMADGTEVVLDVKPADVGGQLKKSGTRSLAMMWSGQESRIAAATKIQAAVRARAARARHNEGRKKKPHHPGLVPMDLR